MRDHGGNMDEAIARFGGCATHWIDLSTGINRVHYPLPALPPEAWTALPTRTSTNRLVCAARAAYGTQAGILPVAGAQAAIQMIPRLSHPGRARVLAPTYNEHAAALRSAAWRVEEVSNLADLAGADLAVVVNPNNPDGRAYDRDALCALSQHVGRLIVDESFIDATPERSIAAEAGRSGIIVLRSFGKFYGLAGLRLGFVLAEAETIAALAAIAGPWPIAGAAIEIGRVALEDRNWAARTAQRLKEDAARLDELAARAGWTLAGGTELFRTYDTADAKAAQEWLARSQIWCRIFPYSARWLRLGLPGTAGEWDRLAGVMGTLRPEQSPA